MKNNIRNWIYPIGIASVYVMLATSCTKEEAPTVGTYPVIDYTMTSAIGRGAITDDGGASVTESGICWSQHATPTLDDDVTTEGANTGIFNSSMTGLTKNTKYYVRAYATNMAGTAYGNEVFFTTYGVMDIDGNGYHTKLIGSQEWMQENLKTTKFRDGSDIPNVISADDWANTYYGAYCEYNNDSASVTTYGRLYNWYTIIDPRNLCPEGWHVPSNEEWDMLAEYLGGEDIAGGKMKATGTVDNGHGLWYSPNAGSTNESGFSGLPGGHRGDTNGGLPFIFTDLHGYGHWWSSTGNYSYAFLRYLIDRNAKLNSSQNYSRNGKSIRCIKD